MASKECENKDTTSGQIKLSSASIYMTQDAAIASFKEQGMDMMSEPDLYQVITTGSEEDKEKLRQVCKDSVLLTSSRYLYNKTTMMAEIIHNFGSSRQTSIKLNIPYIDGNINKASEELLQAKYGTKDSKEKIISNLKAFGQDRKLWFYTPDQDWRARYPVLVSGLSFNDSSFGMGSDGHPDIHGDGFGVLSDTAKRGNFPNKILSNRAIFDFENKMITIPMRISLIKDMKRKFNRKKRIKIIWSLKTRLK